MSVFVPAAEWIVYETNHWRVNHRTDATLPGYLIIAAKVPMVHDWNDLSSEALHQIGPVVRQAVPALQTHLQPDHVYTCRFGHSAGHTLHFHVIPISPWVKAAYDSFRNSGGQCSLYPSDADGPSLSLFITEEFTQGRSPCPLSNPSVGEVITLLREHLSPSRIKL